MRYFIPFLTVFLFVLAVIPILRFLGLRYRFVDRPNPRKIHTKAVPLLGGLAIYGGVASVLLLFEGWTALSVAIVIGGAMVVTVGMLDDHEKSKGRDFPVWPRLIVYFTAAAVPYWLDIRISGMSSWTGEGMILFPEWFVFLATVLWVFSLMNMVNFIDGVDGLAAGIVVLSSMTLFVAALLRNQSSAALLAIILIGASLAFLAYNFYPARIFMGDSGAVFLGYALAVLAMYGTLKSATLISLCVSLLALGVPIIDTVVVMTRRLLEGRGLYRADKLHTHHSLMNWGLTQTQTVSFLYLIGGVFSLLAIILLLLFR